MRSSGAEQVNNTAFIVGFWMALFGIFGVSHLFNGRIRSFILNYFLGLLWVAFFVTLSLFSIGLCAIGGLIPLHIILAYVSSRDGSRI
jgi:hypothetical protein